MHIGFDAKRLFLNASGLGNYSRTLVEQLRTIESNDEITLFTPKTAADQRTKRFLTGDFNIILPSGLPKMLHSWWRSTQIAQLAERHNVQIYHGLSNELPAGLKAKGIKTVVTVHDLIFLRYPQTYPVIDRMVYKMKVSAACRQADAIVAISKKTAADLVDLLHVNPKKIHVIYQGCESAFGADYTATQVTEVLSRLELRKPYIISVGTIEERKNQLALLQAYQSSSIKSDYDLVLVGKTTAYANSLFKFVTAHGLETRVHFLQDLPFQDLPPLLKGASLMVYPSRYEGFGLPVLEAMTAKLPVLAGLGSCLEEVGGKAAKYFNPDDINQLKDLMESVLSDEAERKSMISLGLMQAAQFDAKQMAQAYYALYQKLLET